MRVQIFNNWIRAEDAQPERGIFVLAWDGEEHFLAFYDRGWVNAHLEEEIDSVITHWCELPEPSEEQL